MSCIYQDRFTDGGLFLCRQFMSWCAFDRCENCPYFAAGSALPILVELSVGLDESEPETEKKCVYEGEAVFDEPCSCGSSTWISIHSCSSPERVRGWQKNSWCVPLLVRWDQLADPMARTSFQCCESCEFRQESAAPADRQNKDDQSDANESVEP
jgi:hypothetical protein